MEYSRRKFLGAAGLAFAGYLASGCGSDEIERLDSILSGSAPKSNPQLTPIAAPKPTAMSALSKPTVDAKATAASTKYRGQKLIYILITQDEQGNKDPRMRIDSAEDLEKRIQAINTAFDLLKTSSTLYTGFFAGKEIKVYNPVLAKEPNDGVVIMENATENNSRLYVDIRPESIKGNLLQKKDNSQTLLDIFSGSYKVPPMIIAPRSGKYDDILILITEGQLNYVALEMRKPTKTSPVHDTTIVTPEFYEHYLYGISTK